MKKISFKSACQKTSESSIFTFFLSKLKKENSKRFPVVNVFFSRVFLSWVERSLNKSERKPCSCKNSHIWHCWTGNCQCVNCSVNDKPCRLRDEIWGNKGRIRSKKGKRTQKFTRVKRARVWWKAGTNVFIKLDARNQFPRLWGASINFPSTA